METQTIMTELKCDKCLRLFSKDQIKPVVIGNNSVKRYCEDCLADLKISIKNEKAAFRKYRNNPLFNWRGNFLIGIAITAIIGIILLIIELIR
jgi:hypothetical protein